MTTKQRCSIVKPSVHQSVKYVLTLCLSSAHAHLASCTLQEQAEVITAATLTWRQWHLNYYHGLGESVFEVHSLACKWLGYCGAANSSELAPIFIERPGDQASWAQFLPAAESALKCLFPGPNYFIGDDRIHNKASCFQPVMPLVCGTYS